MRAIAAGFALAFVTVLPTLAHAENTNKSADAEKLFGEGKALMKAHALAEACSKFEQSEELDPGVGNELWLADCYEQSGKLAEAYRQFTATEKLAASLQDHRDAVAHKRAAALLDKLPTLSPAQPVVHVDGADGAVVEPLVQKVALAPEARSPLRASYASDFAPDLAARSPLRVLAPITVAVGIVGLGFGTALEVLAQGNRNDSSTHCPSTCDAQGAQLRQNAFAADVASAVSVITGGLLVATGATMMLVAPLSRSEKLAFAPAVSPTFAGFVGQGRF